MLGSSLAAKTADHSGTLLHTYTTYSKLIYYVEKMALIILYTRSLLSANSTTANFQKFPKIFIYHEFVNYFLSTNSIIVDKMSH